MNRHKLDKLCQNQYNLMEMKTTGPLLESLSLKEKIGQMFLIGFSGFSLPDEVRTFIEESNIGFTILFSKNINHLNQTINLTNSLHQLGQVEPFIFADQEGGTVVQFRELTSTMISPMGLAHTSDPRLARTAGSIIAKEMFILGIDGLFSPVLDTNTEEDNPIIGIRSFSNDPRQVSRYGLSYLEGIKGEKVVACCKHFPGHGDTVTDSHQELPHAENTIDNLRSCHLIPFAAAVKNGVEAILTSHILFKKISNKIATFDPFLLNQILRSELGFKGLIFTDCLEMKAIKNNFSPEEIVLGAVNAGIDVLAASQSLEFQKELFNSFLSLVERGKISEDRINRSVSRILLLKKKYTFSNSRREGLAEQISFIRGSVHRTREAEIAQKSILVKQDTDKLLPLSPSKKTLLIEWEKVKATMTLKDVTPQFMMKEILQNQFRLPENLTNRMLPLDGSIPDDLAALLPDFEQIICGEFSRTTEPKNLQIKSLKKILGIRRDIVIIALGNPFELNHLSGASTLIATFGFRNCQLEALLDILLKP